MKKKNQKAIFPARRPSKDFDEPLTGPRISMPSLPRTQVLVLEMIRGGTVVFLLFLDALASLKPIVEIKWVCFSRLLQYSCFPFVFFQRNLMTIEWAENIKTVPLHLFLHHWWWQTLSKKTKKTLSGSELHNVTDIADISV